MRLALLGCGDVSRRYAASIGAAPGLELVAVTDADAGRACALAGELGLPSPRPLAELLGDGSVDTVVVLTPPATHAKVAAACLEAGKHVHTEKPLALSHPQAVALAELARARGVRLSCAPATLLGEAQQTAWKLLREGAIGPVRVAYAEANWGTIESWHPAPEGLFAVGPLVDLGVYPLTLLTAMLGPARRVHAHAWNVLPERRTRAGVPFRPEAPDHVVAVLELEGGAIARVTASFYAGPGTQRGIELHGDEGRLFLASWAEADSRLELTRRGAQLEPVPLVREPYRGIDWARPLVDLREAIEEGRPHRAGAEHAAHVVEVLAAASLAAATGTAVDVHGSFDPPEPAEWARPAVLA